MPGTVLTRWVALFGCVLLSGCVSVFSRVGMRGTNDYPVYPGVANHVYWIGVSDDAFDWLALVVDGPLCLVLDTVLLPVDVVWQIVKPSDRDAAGN